MQENQNQTTLKGVLADRFEQEGGREKTLWVQEQVMWKPWPPFVYIGIGNLEPKHNMVN